MLFWKLPENKFLAFIPRTGSTAWGQAILDKFYPKDKIRQQKTDTPDNTLAIPQFFIPSERDPKGTVFGVIRNPIERFRSGFSRAAHGKTVDEIIAVMQTSKVINIHIRPITSQFESFKGEIKWYKHESGLIDLAKDIGLDSVPDIQNESDENDKPTLTEEQIQKLNVVYAKDIELYNSLV